MGICGRHRANERSRKIHKCRAWRIIGLGKLMHGLSLSSPQTIKSSHRGAASLSFCNIVYVILYYPYPTVVICLRVKPLLCKPDSPDELWLL